jgi:predicted acetyltransferase
MPTPLELRVPSRDLLPQYLEALETGWSQDNVRGRAASEEELAEIAKDAAAFLARQVDREAKGPPITLPDGSKVQRLPGFNLWMTDGDFCGSINLRWQPGTCELPVHVPGHIGYSVVPWKRDRGYATSALRLMLGHAAGEGLAHVEITTDPDNVASQKVIERNGGVLVERFMRPPAWGEHKEGLRYRVPTRSLAVVR